MVEQVDAAVIERIGQPVTRPIDRENAMVLCASAARSSTAMAVAPAW